jgi:hypothetical protein
MEKIHRGVCCVCGIVYREGIEPVTHGYCNEHFLEAMNQIEERKKNEKLDTTNRNFRV